MSGFLAAVGMLLPFADPDLSYPLPAGADLRVGRPSRTAGPGFLGAAFSPDGTKLAAMTNRGVTVRTVPDGRRLFDDSLIQLRGGAGSDGLAFSPCGQFLAYLDVGSSRAFVAEVATGAWVKLDAAPSDDGGFVTSHIHFVSKGVVRVLGRPLAKGEEEVTFEAVDFDPATGARLARRTLPTRPIAVARDGRALMLRDDTTGRRFDTTVWRYAGTPLPGLGISSAIDADCRRVVWTATGKVRTDVTVTDAVTGKALRTVPMPDAVRLAEYYSLGLAPDGGEFYLIGYSKKEPLLVRRWRVADGKELPAILHAGVRIDLCVVYGPGADAVTLIGEDGFLATFDRATGARRGPATRPMRFAASPDGRLLASFDGDAFVVRDSATGRVTRSKREPAAVGKLGVNDDGERGVPVGELVVSPDAKRQFRVEGDRLRVSDRDTGKIVRDTPIPPNHPDESGDPQQLAVTPDGRTVAVATHDHIDLFDAAGDHRRRVQVIPVREPAVRLIHSDWTQHVHGIALSSDGVWLALGHVSYINSGGVPPSGTVEIYEVATGSRVATVEARLLTPKPLTFSPSGRHLWAVADHEALRFDLKPPKLPVFDRRTIVTELRGENAALAYLAAGRLAAPGMLAWLGEQLLPDKMPDEARVAALVGQLSDREFAAREEATAALTAMGPGAAAALRAVLKAPASAEAGRRAEVVLNRVSGESAPDVLLRKRALAAVAMLAEADDSAARKLLDAWAKGDPGLPLTDAARAALARRPK